MTPFSWIKQHVSILSHIGEYVRLQRIGHYWKGPCPFHSERDASFTVSPEKGMFYCFGCQAGGDVISFVERIESCGPLEAVTMLLERYRLTMPEELFAQMSKEHGSTLKVNQGNDFYAVYQEVALWCHQQLIASPLILDYLLNRGITRESITRFSLGYFSGSSRDMEKLLHHFASKQLLVKTLVQTGFLMQNGSTMTSPYSERIIFPIYDQLGRCIAFGGRVYRSDDGRARYYNSKESDFFLKKKTLFGLHLARKAFVQKPVAYLVEGYLDCVALSQIGYQGVVATLGTAATEEHFRVLARFVTSVVVVYDGDVAGQKAMLRLVELCWSASLDVFVVTLPPGEDPASLVQKNVDLSVYLDKRRDIFTFFMDGREQAFISGALSERAQIIRELVQVIGKISDIVKKELLLHDAAKAFSMPYDVLTRLAVNDAFRNEGQHNNAGSAVQDQQQKDRIQLAVSEHRVVAGILQNYHAKQIFALLDEDFLQFFSEDGKLVLRQVIQSSHNTHDASLETLYEFLFQVAESYRIGVVSFLMSDGEDDVEAFLAVLKVFLKHQWRNVVVNLKEQLGSAEGLAKGFAEQQRLLKKFEQLRKTMQGKGLL